MDEGESTRCVLQKSMFFSSNDCDSIIKYKFEPGLLSQFEYLCYDVVVHSYDLTVFELTIIESASGKSARLTYGFLNGVQARVRIPLSSVLQNILFHEREGAWIKPISYGDVVDLSLADTIEINLIRKSESKVEWEQTELQLHTAAPELLTNPHIMAGTILDDLGQDARREWPGKTTSFSEFEQRVLEQHTQSEQSPRLVKNYSQWGGYKERTVETSGYFNTHHDGTRWWLVDPDGHPFWSAGLDCVSPATTSATYNGLDNGLPWTPALESEEYDSVMKTYRDDLKMIDYLVAGLIKVFGFSHWYEAWTQIFIYLFHDIGFNSVGNWSDIALAQEKKLPYVTGLLLDFERTALIFRDFPDVYSDTFPQDLIEIAQGLVPLKHDTALIGYFLGNEPEWGFSDVTPAAGMLINTETCQTRVEFKNYLINTYQNEEALQKIWGCDVSFNSIEKGVWSQEPPESANGDLESFSTIMIAKLFGDITAACKKVDPHHLNLGNRFYTIPKKWALLGMKDFDVFSINSYNDVIQPEIETEIIAYVDKPILIGEFHFGALDVGLHASGIVRVKNQEDRGKAYRVYVEDAVTKPWCVGVHYFILYDQSSMGRFDGEAYQVGFLDVCNKPYVEIYDAARKTHERLYDLALGKCEPYTDRPEYLSRLFC